MTTPTVAPQPGDAILVVKDPWIDWLLDGTKSLELRGTRCHKPDGARIYLSRSGTGEVHGCVTFHGMLGPLTRDELEALKPLHRVSEVASITYAHTYAWIFTDPVCFEAPIPYHVKRGSITWRIFSPRS